MITVGKPKPSHPNKLVVQHEMFLANKSLVTKMRTVKSSIPQPNREFEKKIENRKKKEISKSQNTGSLLDNETLKVILEQRINLLTAPAFQAEEQDLGITAKINTGFRASYEKPKTSTVYNAYLTNQYQMPRTASTREMSYQRSNSLLNRVSSPKQATNLQPLQSYGKAIPSTNDNIVLLKNQLEEKNLEMQAFQDELKDWWHEDFKLQQLGKPKFEGKTTVSDRYSDEKMVPNKENKKIQKLSEIEQESKSISENKNTNLNLKGIRKQQLPSISSKKVSNTITDLQKGADFKKNVKIVDETSQKQCENENDTQRPSTVKFPLRTGNHEFKIRSSGHFDTTASKRNLRYDSSPSRKQREETGETENDIGILPNQNFPFYKERAGQNQQDSSSPQIFATSKSLMQQAPVRKTTNSHYDHRFQEIPEQPSEYEINNDDQQKESRVYDQANQDNIDEMCLSMINPMDNL